MHVCAPCGFQSQTAYQNLVVEGLVEDMLGVAVVARSTGSCRHRVHPRFRHVCGHQTAPRHAIRRLTFMNSNKQEVWGSTYASWALCRFRTPTRTTSCRRRWSPESAYAVSSRTALVEDSSCLQLMRKLKNVCCKHRQARGKHTNLR
jgi:hypothetical protein